MKQITLIVNYRVLVPENLYRKIIRILQQRRRGTTLVTRAIQLIGQVSYPDYSTRVTVYLPEQGEVAWLRKMRNQMDNVWLHEDRCPEGVVLRIIGLADDFRLAVEPD